MKMFDYLLSRDHLFSTLCLHLSQHELPTILRADYPLITLRRREV